MKRYRIPKEIESEIKITKLLTSFDLFLIVGLFMFRFITINFVHSDLKMFYTIFLIAFGLFMIIRPKTNPKKRMLHAMYYALIRKKDTYSPIDYNQ